ncbi:MAG: hypothetical protein AAF490_00775 [Chloroflexota bacterium]
MHRRGRFFRFLLAGLLIFTLFGAMRGGAYRSGYARGFYEGQTVTQQQAEPTLPEGGAETAVPANESFRRGPVYGPGYGGGHHHFGFFGFIGGLFQFFFTLLFFGFIFKMMGFLFWRRYAFNNGWKGPRGPYGRHSWSHRGQRRWQREDSGGYEKSPEDVDPDVRTL